jgi:hypothetical protein
MPLTTTRNDLWGNSRVTLGTYTFSSSYPTGGESLSAADLGMRVIEKVHVSQGVGGYVFRYNYSTQKLMVFKGNGAAVLTEEANATNLSSITVNLQAIGQ